MIWPEGAQESSEEVTFDVYLVKQYFEWVKTQALDHQLYFLLFM